MTLEELKIQQFRSEGFAEGFKAGYAAALAYVAEQISKENKDAQSNEREYPKLSK